MDLRVFFCWVNLRQSRGEKRVLRENFLKKIKKRRPYFKNVQGQSRGGKKHLLCHIGNVGAWHAPPATIY